MSVRMTFVFIFVTCFLCCISPGNASPVAWRDILISQLPLFGHRNWIAVVDSAYPLQSRAGIETVVTNESQLTVLKTVLADIKASRHVKPVIYTDEELQYVADSDCPGVEEYREELSRIVGGLPATSLLHEKIIAKLDQAGQTFSILILKSNMTIPYTSVFINLGCKYSTDAIEQHIRARMKAAGAE